MKRRVDQKTKARADQKTKAREAQLSADGRELLRVRERHGWSQSELARMLKIRQPLVSAWEAGRKRTSPRMYARLTPFLLDYEEQLWAAAKSGWDEKAVAVLAEGYLRRRGSPQNPTEVISVPPMPGIEPRGPDLFLSRSEVPATLRLFYVRIRDDEFTKPLYRSGDVIFLDASQNDLRRLEDGALVAVASDIFVGLRKSGKGIWVGFLRKSDTPFGNFTGADRVHAQADVKICVLQLPSEEFRLGGTDPYTPIPQQARVIYIGTSGPEPVETETGNTVLGRIVGSLAKSTRSERAGATND